MIEPEELREQIEACRPGHDDLSLPEFAEARAALNADADLRKWHDELQRQDAAIARAWREAPVPEGLEQRLLTALAQQREAVPADEAAVQPASTVDVRAPRGRRWLRRSVLAVMVTGAGLLLAAALWWQQPPRLTLDSLGELSRSLADEAMAWDHGAWQPFDSAEFPGLRWRPARWREVATPIDDSTLVFEFQLRDGGRLFLIQCDAANTCNLPPVPFQSLGGTGPWKMGAWYEAGVLNIAVTNQGNVLESFRAPYRAT